jgi:hypothetical protein
LNRLCSGGLQWPTAYSALSSAGIDLTRFIERK